MQTLQLQYTTEEANSLLNLLDMAVKYGGRQAAGEVAYHEQKLIQAEKERQKALQEVNKDDGEI